MKVDVSRDHNHVVRITEIGGDTIMSQSVEANLMYIMVVKLDEIRCGIIDVETAIKEDK